MGLIVFWSAAGALLYILVAFPALTLARGWLRRRPYRTGEMTPSVTVVIAAHNEAAHIGARIENLLALDYPRDRLEIVIASDGSTDGTEEIVRRYEPQGVRLLALPRLGKFAALNRAVAEARGETLVFSDANTIFAPDALRALVRPLADPEVGGVAGNQVYLKEKRARASSDGERLYWSFDRMLKQAQSRAGSVTSATGAIYAVRRELVGPIPPAVTDDFYTSTGVVAQGYRSVFAEDAVGYEPTAGDSRGEFRRKVRVMTRGLWAIVVRRELLNPRRFGFYSLQLLSHKVLRRLTVFPLTALFAASLCLWSEGAFYLAAALAQAVFYGCAALGLLLAHTPLGRVKPLSVPLYFCLIHVAAAWAVWNTVSGRRIERWSTARAAPASASA